MGGTANNSACMMSTLGLKVVSLSSAGDDRYGQLIVDDFNRHGVDTRYIRSIPAILIWRLFSMRVGKIVNLCAGEIIVSGISRRLYRDC